MTPQTEDLITDLTNLRVVLKSGDYDGADLMWAWCAMSDAAQALRALQAEVERLRGALEPFAKAADSLRSDDPDRDRPAYATAADYRRARSALTGSAQG